MGIKSSFAPVIDKHTRVVILGSLPGDASLAAQQYYAHPRNQFWRLIGDLLQQELTTLPYSERLPVLLHHHIGLWDVVGHAERHGSLDSALRHINPNDLDHLRAQCPGLRAVGCNGQTATRHAQGLTAHGIAVLALPSSSPAHTRAYAEKLAVWRQLLPVFLE